MSTILAVAGVVVLAFVGAQLYRWRRAPAWLEDILFSGLPFFLVGWAFGSQGAGLFDAGELSGLAVLVNLAVGWVGLLLGLQFDGATWRRLPAAWLGAAGVESAVVLVVVGGGCLLVVGLVQPGESAWWLALLLGTLALPSAPTLAARGRRSAGMLTRPRALLAMASLDGLPALVLVSALLCFLPGRQPEQAWLALLLTFGLGLSCGILLHLLTLARMNDNELLVLLLGVVLFTGGAAQVLGLSPPMVTMLAGLVVAARSPRLGRVRGAMVRLEKPVYLVMLTLAGATWSPPWQAAGLVVLFVLLRLVAKLVGGAIAAAWLPATLASPLLGAGLVPHGALALALALSLYGPVERSLVDVAMAAVVASMLVGIWLGRRATELALRGRS